MDRRDFLQATTFAVAATTYGSASSSAMVTGGHKWLNDLVQLAATAPVTPTDFDKLHRLLDDVSPLSTIRDQLGNIISAPTPDFAGLPDILKPIDVGAADLLKDLTKAQLQYSPMEVEYLANTLNDHINNCLTLREKAQQLEVLASAARLELLLEQKTIEFMVTAADHQKTNGPHIAGTMYDPIVTASKIASSPDGEAYYKRSRDIENILLDARREIIGARLALLRQSGSGNNHTQRFEFLKDSFKHELAEAFLRARSVAVGCQEIYRLEIGAVPTPTDVGYLNKLADWASNVFVALERAVMSKTSTVVAVALRKGLDPMPGGLLSEQDYVAGRNTGAFTVKITSDFFNTTTLSLKNPRLLGLEVYTWTDTQPKSLDFVRVRVTLPDQSIGSVIPKVWSFRPVVTLPMATFPQGPGFEFQPRREVHNASPIGDWTIQFDKRTITDHDATKDEMLKNIFLVMRLSVDVVA